MDLLHLPLLNGFRYPLPHGIHTDTWPYLTGRLYRAWYGRRAKG